jgi:hypothetical protein
MEFGCIPAILFFTPKRKTELSDQERAKRIQETAREIGADATREEFERAFKKIVPAKRFPSMPPAARSRRNEKPSAS